VPAYIAYGLIQYAEQNSLFDKAGNKGKGSVVGKDSLAPQDQELHQQMLRKLALHLAAHAQLQSEPPQHEEHTTQSPQIDVPAPQNHESQPPPLSPPKDMLQERRPSVPKIERGTEGNVAKDAREKGRSLQEQEFQQEMLRKLALHLAAQEEQASLESVSDSREVAVDADVKEIINTPDVFPATPSSYGEEPCEHYFIGDDLSDQAVDESVCCSQCVWVPMHIAYGLIEGIAHGQDRPGGKTGKGTRHGGPTSLGSQGHDFHEQMLQKLALHLAAQPEPLDSSSQDKDQALCSTSKVAWADMVDDEEVMLASHVEVQKPRITCNSSKDSPEGMRGKEANGNSFSLSFNPKQKGPEQQEFEQEMLRKLALHLAAQPESTEHPEEVAFESVSEARALGEDKARCEQFMVELADSTEAARAKQVVEKILPGARTLSLTPNGSRLVQKVIDVASVKQHEQLLRELLKDVTELYTSPHANHVIAKLIEIMPAKSLASIGEAMRGKATTVARHQFGSRILERLVEHCDEALIGFLLDELMEDFEALARHQFGNFVVARILEHSTAARKHTCVHKLLPHVLQHATHKTACNIVERMLDNSDLTCQAMIADAFLAGTAETSLEAIAATRYGSFVIQHLVNRFHPRIDAVKARVKAAHSQLKASGFSQRKIVQFLGDAFFRD